MTNKKEETFLIFDFDNTLADTLAVIIEIMKRLAKKEGFDQVTEKQIKLFREKGMIKACRQLKIPLKKLPSIIKIARKDFSQQIERFKLHDGIKELLISLKSKKFNLGILTSNSVANVQKFLNKNQINCFDFVYSENNIFGKARGLNNLVKKHKINKQKTFYIGDEIRDVQAAQRAGLKMIAVGWGFNTVKSLKEYKPDFLVNKPQEILRVLS